MKPAGRPVRPKISEFGPAWLRQQLARLLPDGRHAALCVAFSGGSDSTALLAALARLPGRRHRLRAIHIDHGLHARSAAWSAPRRAGGALARGAVQRARRARVAPAR